MEGWPVAKAGGAILVIRRDQTADAVGGRDEGAGSTAVAEGWLECGCHICANYRRALRERDRTSGVRVAVGGRGNDEISGVTVTIDGVSFVSAGKVRGGNFSNPSL